MKTTIISIIILICSLESSTQFKMPTKIQFDILSMPIDISGVNDTNLVVYHNTTDNQEVQLKFLDSCGTATIKMIRDGVVTVEGSYACNGVIHHRLSKLIDLEGNVTSVTITYYFIPVRDSKWTYYNKDGKVFRTELYNRGAVLNSHEY